MIDRRLFLRGLAGITALAAAPTPVIYVFAPSGGWQPGRLICSFNNIELRTKLLNGR